MCVFCVSALACTQCVVMSLQDKKPVRTSCFSLPLNCKELLGLTAWGRRLLGFREVELRNFWKRLQAGSRGKKGLLPKGHFDCKC